MRDGSSRPVFGRASSEAATPRTQRERRRPVSTLLGSSVDTVDLPVARQVAPAEGPGSRAPQEDDKSRPPNAKRTWLPVVAVCSVYALLAIMANGSSWAHGVAHTLQTSGDNDPGEEVWFLAQTPWAILHGHNPFVNDWLNAPVGLNLMDNTTMPLLGLLFAPVTLLFGPIATFNVVLDAAIFSSATAFFFMARRFVGWWPAAFVGGLLYGFSPFMVAEGNAHLFLLFQAAPPLIILFLDRFLRTPSTSPGWTGVAIGACFVAQFYVSTEGFASLVIMTLVAAIVAGGYVLVRHAPVDVRRIRRMSACALAVIVLGVGYAGWTAIEGPHHVNGPVQSTQAITDRSTDPVGLLAPTSNQLLAPKGTPLGDFFVAGPIENGSYLGVPLLLVLVIGVRQLRRRRLVLYCAAMAGVALVLSMGTDLQLGGHRTGIPLPYSVLAHLPLLNGAIPSRWFFYVWLFAALLFTLIVDAVHTHLADGRCGRHRLGAFAASSLLAVCVVIPLIPAWPYPAAAAPVPAWFTDGARSLPVGSTAVVYPSSTPRSSSAMLWQAMANMQFRMPGGYAVFATPTGATFDSQPSALHSALVACFSGHPPTLAPATTRAQLRAIGASTVVVVPGTRGASCAARLFERALGPARSTQGVLLWRKLICSRKPSPESACSSVLTRT
jgi:hypothetical protein